jgi:hypothetical protein
LLFVPLQRPGNNKQAIRGNADEDAHEAFETGRNIGDRAWPLNQDVQLEALLFPPPPGSSLAATRSANFRRPDRGNQVRTGLRAGASRIRTLGPTPSLAGRQTAKRTRERFGFPINPHCFRDCATTSIAINDPENIGIVPRMLAHRNRSTAERFYNQAHALEASRAMQKFLLSLRHGTAPRRS